MKCIYLIQSDSDKILFEIPAHVDRLLLQWQSCFIPCEHSFHYPNSTWAAGRNELYRRALEKGTYDYYIFADDDVALNFDLQDFERLLEVYQPRRASPHQLGQLWNHFPRSRIDRVKYVDHSLMAFRADCASALLPYTLIHDTTSWWQAAEDMCERFWERWPFETLRFNLLTYKNVQSRPYPKIDMRTPPNLERVYEFTWDYDNISRNLKWMSKTMRYKIKDGRPKARKWWAYLQAFLGRR